MLLSGAMICLLAAPRNCWQQHNTLRHH